MAVQVNSPIGKSLQVPHESFQCFSPVASLRKMSVRLSLPYALTPWTSPAALNRAPVRKILPNFALSSLKLPAPTTTSRCSPPYWRPSGRVFVLIFLLRPHPETHEHLLAPRLLSTVDR